jgi:hypothetical protein
MNHIEKKKLAKAEAASIFRLNLVPFLFQPMVTDAIVECSTVAEAEKKFNENFNNSFRAYILLQTTK